MEYLKPDKKKKKKKMRMMYCFVSDTGILGKNGLSSHVPPGAQR